MKKILAATAVALVALMSLSACGGASDEQPATQASGIAIADQWVKATEGQQMADMSAGFGVLSNSSESDAEITAVTASVTERAELHETVDGQMQKVDGFTIPAGGSFTLEPGANHLMLLDLTDPIKPGDDVEFTLTFADDSTFEFTATAKDFTGADENYDEGGDMADME